MPKKLTTIRVKNNAVALLKSGEEGYISLTDIARYKDSDRSDYILQNWLRSKDTIEFIGLWEQLHNPDFKSIEFDGFRNEAGSNSFSLTPKRWIQSTNAIGIISKSGRYGGTFAHIDIAYEFASWISAEFKLYLIKEYQRLKKEEQSPQALEWDVKRTLAKVNYAIHTDAIKERLIPPELAGEEAARVYASEADLLNKALYGMTAKEWREANPGDEGNIRDHSTMEQLLILANMESMNAEYIRMGLPPEERIIKLNGMARQQMQSLLKHQNAKKPEG